MKTKLAMVSVFVVMALMSVCVVHADQGDMDKWQGRGRGAAIWNDLSKEQKAQASALRLDFMKKANELRSQMGKKRIELLELNSAEKPDEQAIQKKREEVWALQDTMRNELRTMSTKFRALLTPEQREKLGPFGFGMGKGCNGFGCGGGNLQGGMGCRGGGPGMGFHDMSL